MKALTICQPYAEMILQGEKLVENRSWPTSHRGRMYIHAGKNREFWDDEVDRKRYPNAAWGAVVAIVNLVDCVRLDDPKAHERYPWLRKHQHSYGPWCWILEGVNAIGPWPWRGAQGLFDIDEAELGRVANRELGVADQPGEKL